MIKSWFWYALYSVFGYGIGGFLVYVIGALHKGGTFNPLIIALLFKPIYIIISCVLYYLKNRKIIGKNNKGIFKNYSKDFSKIIGSYENILYVIGISLTQLIGNIFVYIAYFAGPNPGFADGISGGTYPIFIIIIMYLLAGQKVKLINLAGVILMMFSIFLIS